MYASQYAHTKSFDLPFFSEARKPTLRKRPLPQNTQHQMEAELLAQRDAMIERNPALAIFPKSIACPLSVIQEVCSRSSSVQCINDMQSFKGLRQELHSPFFHVIIRLRSGHHRNCAF